MMKRWGDDMDDSDDEAQPQQSSSGGAATNVDIPPTHKSKVDSKGIQIVTSYRAHPSNAGQLIKTTTKIRVSYTTVREHVSVSARRKWKKFGQAALDEDQSNVTIQSRDDVYLEDPNADTDLQDEDPSKALAGNLNAFWAKQQRRQLERKYDVDDDADGTEGAGAGGPGAGWTQVGAASSGGKYVPPSQRGGASSVSALASKAGVPQRADDLNTIRVTNISENTTEADLQDLFQPFGRISRVYLAKDKETMISRGFAFVSFVHKEDAAKAMDKLQGFGYDHLILKLEWARPNAPKDPAAATEYRSGYGKALAQDTKEKVSYASNLTKGVR
jgi:translation initiation factor 3 subunit G